MGVTISLSKRFRVCVIVLALLPVLGCSEINKTNSPVELIATAQQNVSVIDLLNLPTANIGTIEVRAISKRTDADPTFMDVKLKSYRVSYQRTDGGTLVPEPFTRTTSGLVPVNGSGTALDDFVLVQPGALIQAPFAALYASAGGVDPETGQSLVKMDAIVDIFGETLAGEDVSARVRIPLWFCAGCSQ
ncbi:MAG: hypothetical protein WBX15_03095 [Thermoanaerobaculia bacterium]